MYSMTSPTVLGQRSSVGALSLALSLSHSLSHTLSHSHTPSHTHTLKRGRTQVFPSDRGDGDHVLPESETCFFIIKLPKVFQYIYAVYTIWLYRV